MGDQKNADLLALDQRDQIFHHAGAHDRIKRGEWLVHQHELWPHRQHLRKRDALALSAAQAARKAVAKPREIEPREPCVGLGQRFTSHHAVECEAERDILARRFPRQQRIILEQDAELRACKVRFDRA